MGADDDLHGFDEESLLRALRAPGSSSELADEERYVAAFREFHTSGGRPRRGGRSSRRGGGAARRLGAGTALAVVVGVSGGGVAAAYSGGLPDPLQNFAHRVLGPVPGAPPPADRDPQQRQSAAPRSPASPSPTTATPSPSAAQPTPTSPASPTPNPGPSKGSKPSKDPSDRPSKDPSNTNSPEPSPTPSPVATPTTTPEVTPSPSASPSSPAPSPSASASSSPSPTAPPPPAPTPAPAKLTIQGGAVRVDVGQTTSFSGTVTAKDGSPIPGTKVALQQRGPDGWSRVAIATSDDAGSVTFTSAPVSQTIVVRLRSAPASSETWRVVMRPLLTLSSEVAGSAQGSEGSKVAISTSAAGGQQGDLIRLLAQKGGDSVLVGEGLLDANGAFQFRITQSKRRMTYVVVLPQTEAHGPGRASIRVTLPDDDS